MRFILAAGLTALAAWPALADMELQTNRYLCDRGVEVPATYVNDGQGGSIVVLNVEGRQITLMSEPAASGARYSWPSGGSHYVWHTRGDEALLLWRDGAEGTEIQILVGCRAQ